MKRQLFSSNLTDSDFKYTSNEQRVIWTKNMYPLMPSLIQAVTDIDFDSFTYNGNPANIYHKYTNTEGKLVDDLYEDIVNYEKGITHHFFGGSCYVLLDSVYGNDSGIRLDDFMDPTGDIDVRFEIPNLTKISAKTIQNRVDMTEIFEDDSFSGEQSVVAYKTIINNKLHPFIDSILKYLFDELLDSLQKNGLKTIELTNSVPFDIKEYADIPDLYRNSGLEYRKEMLGNAYLVSFVDVKDDSDKGMLRVQLIAKIKEGDTEVIDHVLELVAPYTAVKLDVRPSITKDYMDLYIDSISKTVAIETYGKLVEGTLNAYITRVNTIRGNNEYFHKGINHIARLLYLYELLSHYLVDGTKPTNNTRQNHTPLTLTNSHPLLKKQYIKLKDDKGALLNSLSEIVFYTFYKLQQYKKKNNTTECKYFKILNGKLVIYNTNFTNIFKAYAPLLFTLSKEGKNSYYLNICHVLKLEKNDEYRLVPPIHTMSSTLINESYNIRSNFIQLVKQNFAQTYLRRINSPSLKRQTLKKTPGKHGRSRRFRRNTEKKRSRARSRPKR